MYLHMLMSCILSMWSSSERRTPQFPSTMAEVPLCSWSCAASFRGVRSGPCRGPVGSGLMMPAAGLRIIWIYYCQVIATGVYGWHHEQHSGGGSDRWEGCSRLVRTDTLSDPPRRSNARPTVRAGRPKRVTCHSSSRQPMDVRLEAVYAASGLGWRTSATSPFAHSANPPSLQHSWSPKPPVLLVHPSSTLLFVSEIFVPVFPNGVGPCPPDAIAPDRARALRKSLPAL